MGSGKVNALYALVSWETVKASAHTVPARTGCCDVAGDATSVPHFTENCKKREANGTRGLLLDRRFELSDDGGLESGRERTAWFDTRGREVRGRRGKRRAFTNTESRKRGVVRVFGKKLPGYQMTRQQFVEVATNLRMLCSLSRAPKSSVI